MIDFPFLEPWPRNIYLGHPIVAYSRILIRRSRSVIHVILSTGYVKDAREATVVADEHYLAS